MNISDVLMGINFSLIENKMSPCVFGKDILIIYM